MPHNTALLPVPIQNCCRNQDIPETVLTNRFGRFTLRAYLGSDGSEPVAMISGNVQGGEHVPVRVHSACFTSENIGSLRCDCREQLDFAMEYVARETGVIVYLHQEGRGIGLSRKIQAYALQEQGHDTVEANTLLGLPEDARTYEDAACILKDISVRSIRLMTNNPHKIASLRQLGIRVTGRIPVIIPPNLHSERYLHAKFTRMGHIPE